MAGQGTITEAAGLDNAADDQVTDAGGQDHGEDAPEVIERARQMGWQPLDEFKGDPAKHIPASEFVRRGEEMLPIVKSQLSKSERKIQELERERAADRAEFERKLARAERMNTVALQRQRAELEGQYEAERRKAAEVGDMERYDKLGTAKQNALKKFDEENETVTKEDEPQKNGADKFTPYERKIAEEWVGRNPWFLKDQTLNLAAQAFDVELQAEHPGMDIAERLDAVTKEMKRVFPKKFGITQRARNDDDGDDGDEPVTTRRGSPVEGTGRGVGNGVPGGRREANLVARLRREDPEAVKQAERMIKQGTFKDLNDYATVYYDQQSNGQW